MTSTSSISTEEKIERLWAISEIKNLPLKYAHSVDTRDWALFESLWVETETPSDRLIDIHVIRQLSTGMLKDAGASTFFITNHIVELLGPDKARGSVYCNCMLELDGQFIEQSIIYKDNYERHDDKWLFLNRDHLLFWGVEKPNPMEQDDANWPQSQVGAGDAFEIIRCR